MDDADRRAQLESLRALKTVLDDENADADDIRDAAIRTVNRFDASIAALPRSPRFWGEPPETREQPTARSVG